MFAQVSQPIEYIKAQIQEKIGEFIASKSRLLRLENTIKNIIYTLQQEGKPITEAQSYLSVLEGLKIDYNEIEKNLNMLSEELKKPSPNYVLLVTKGPTTLTRLEIYLKNLKMLEDAVDEYVRTKKIKIVTPIKLESLILPTLLVLGGIFLVFKKK
jgi:vancomycin resistance protein YoaR